MNITPAILTTGQVAKYSGVSFPTVLRWIDRGELKSYKLPGRGDNRVLLADFIDFLTRHEMPVPPELRDARRGVLIVDDDPVDCAFIESIVGKLGHETRIASDGFAAGTQLLAFLPALVTLDLRMHGIDGYEVIRFIRHNGKLRDIRILVISGGEIKELDRAVREGADRAIRKPADSHSIGDALKSLLGNGSEQERPSRTSRSG